MLHLYIHTQKCNYIHSCAITYIVQLNQLISETVSAKLNTRGSLCILHRLLKHINTYFIHCSVNFVDEDYDEKYLSTNLFHGRKLNKTKYKVRYDD